MSDDESTEFLHNDSDIQVSHFILLKFTVKVNSIHYKRLVLDAHSNVYNVKYLRIIGTSNFYFPHIDVIAICSRNEIVVNLKKPIKSKEM